MKNKNTFHPEMLEDRSLLAVESCTDTFQLTASCVLETAMLAAGAQARINGGTLVLSSDESDLTKTYFNLNNATLQFGPAGFATINSQCSLIHGQSGAAGSDVAIDNCKFTSSYSGAKTQIAPGFLAPVSFPLVTAGTAVNAINLNAGELKFEGPAILTWNIDPDRCQSTFGLEWDVKVTDSTTPVPTELAFNGLGVHVGSGVTALHNPNINFDLCKSSTTLNSEGVFEIKPQKASDPLDIRQQKLNKINNLFPLNLN